MAAEKFQIYGVNNTGKYICESKYRFAHFYLCHQAKILSLSTGRIKLIIPPEQRFLKVFFSEMGEKDYAAKKMIKIKTAMVLVTKFDKFHHLCNLFFLFCCAII